MFMSDRYKTRISITVTLTRSAVIYLFFDDRRTRPAWLILIRYRQWIKMRHGHRMSRPRQPIDVHRHAALVLEKERSETSAWKLQRLQAIRLAMEGRETYQRIADIVLCSAASLCKWIRWFREEGIDGLLGHVNGAGGGKDPRFSPEQWDRFRAELAKGQWRTARDAQHWLKKELGLAIAYKEVYRHLGKIEARRGSGAPQPHQKRPRSRGRLAKRRA